MNNQLGVVPVLGAKLGADAIIGLATTLLPAVMKNRYAETTAMLNQVNQLAPQGRETSAQMQAMTGQVAQAYTSAIANTRDKARQISQTPAGSNKARNIKTAAYVAIGTSLAAVLINELVK